MQPRAGITQNVQLNSIQLNLDFKPAEETSAKAKERYGTEIESIYLTGDFGVTMHEMTDNDATQRNTAGTFQIRPVHQIKSFSVTAEKNEFSGELSTEGYPFYAGSIELSRTFSLPEIDKDKRYFLELPNCEAIVSVVELNGTILDTLCWSPFKTDITNALKNGSNKLKITLINSLRNLLEPYHNKQGKLIKVGPASFAGAGGFPDKSGDKNWYDLRKTTDKLKTWTDFYTIIPLGFLEPVRITEMQN